MYLNLCTGPLQHHLLISYMFRYTSNITEYRVRVLMKPQNLLCLHQLMMTKGWAHKKPEYLDANGPSEIFAAITLLTNALHLASSFLLCLSIFSLKCLSWEKIQIVLSSLVISLNYNLFTRFQGMHTDIGGLCIYQAQRTYVSAVQGAATFSCTEDIHQEPWPCNWRSDGLNTRALCMQGTRRRPEIL